MATEKRFPASRQKKRRSRQQGEAAKSNSLTSALATTAAVIYCIHLLEPLQTLSGLVRKTFVSSTDFHSNHMLLSLSAAGGVLATLVLAPVVVAGLVGVVSEVCQIGFYVLPGQLFRLERLSVANGFRRILGLRQSSSGGVVPVGIPAEIVRHLFYIVSLSLMTGGVIFCAFDELLYFEFHAFAQVYAFIESVVKKLLGLLCSVWIGVGLGEFLISRRQMERRLRMSRSEMERELRETEGDPQFAGMRTQMHQELSMHQVTEQVRRAKAVVVN